jgi:DNA-binding transcriptional MocR family regulator
MEFRYQHIARHFQEAIGTGQLAIGQKLPSLRVIQHQFGCALSVAQQAYGELQTQGLVLSVEKSGYFVAAPTASCLPRPEAIPLSHKAAIPHSTDLVSRVLALASNPRIVPLHGAIPAPSLLPLRSLQSHLRQALQEQPHLFGTYTPAQGSWALRHELAQMLLGRGLHVRPEEILVTNGCSEALRLAIEATSIPGDIIAIETPAFFGMISLLELMGRRAIGIPTRADTGVDLEQLQSILARTSISACLVTPNFQNPLGALMPDAHKERLARMALRFGFTIIEDDIYGDSGAGPGVPLPICALAPRAPVIYCSSFAKTLAPGLRIGFCLPGQHTAMILSKQRGTLGGPPALQEALAHFLSTGSYTRHLGPFRRAMASQVHAMRQLALDHFPAGTRVSHPLGGYFLWIELPRGISSLDIFEHALTQGIGIIPGPAFSLRGSSYLNSLRLSCAQPVDATIAAAVATLGRLAACP